MSLSMCYGRPVESSFGCAVRMNNLRILGIPSPGEQIMLSSRANILDILKSSICIIYLIYTLIVDLIKSVALLGAGAHFGSSSAYWSFDRCAFVYCHSLGMEEPLLLDDDELDRDKKRPMITDIGEMDRSHSDNVCEKLQRCQRQHRTCAADGFPPY